ncbi:MAG: DUF3316 domain-containing protein [Prevotella sp.]|nr:DUF3316 domain-containing protein [Prevotella sp.]
MMRNKTLAFLIMISASVYSQTDSTKIRTSVNMIGVGGTNILDTYLSQEKFSGIGITYLNISERQSKDSPWSTMLQQELSLSSTKDLSKKNTELEGSYSIY